MYPPVDLRSDTVTLPTEQMYDRIASAPLGDDGLDGDPTALELEAEAARLLGKEAALYVPSATMANLLAILAQAGRQEVVLAEAASHIYVTERGAAALTGSFYQGIAGVDGAMDLGLLAQALGPGRNKLRTGLVCLETSHNNAGGAVLPLTHMQAVFAVARDAGAAVHLDGARLMNAAVALGVPAAEITAFADTVSLCLSKGLSAPMGAVLAGPADTIQRARWHRKLLGGSQRQVGIAAAAGAGCHHHHGGPACGRSCGRAPPRSANRPAPWAFRQRAADQHRAGRRERHRARRGSVGSRAAQAGRAGPDLGQAQAALRHPSSYGRARN